MHMFLHAIIVHYWYIPRAVFQRAAITDGFWFEGFSIAALQACNQLPADIHNTATYSTFKHHVKSFLFTVTYGLLILSYSFLGFIIHFS